MKSLAIVMIIAFALSACSAFRPEDGSGAGVGKIHGHADVTKGEIAPAAVYEKLQKGEKIILLDVREAEEYAETHITGTTHRISANDISAETLRAAGIKQTDEIIVYCRSGNRSRTAAQKLRELGFLKVSELNSGIIHWMEDGFPTQSGGQIQPPQPAAQTDGPKIAFDKTNFDFGQVRQLGGSVQTVFKVRNEGNRPLVIGIITTSCSCTTAAMENPTVAPGAETSLTVTFNPNLHEEPKDKFKRTIFIPSNDPQKPEAEITIEVDIVEGE